MSIVPAIERSIEAARQRAERFLREIGREIRAARVSRGLSQRTVARAARLTQSQASRIERAQYPGVTLDTLARLSTAVGLELSVRLCPGGEPVRDKAHIALLARFRRAVGELWRWAAEVPLPIPGDKRAWDRTLTGASVVLGVEGETRPTDLHELGRRLALKKRDGGVDRLILVLADTEWNRRLIRLNDLQDAFPIRGQGCPEVARRGSRPRRRRRGPHLMRDRSAAWTSPGSAHEWGTALAAECRGGNAA
jgi:transcriptional regulator with XRE-family HTH domain